MNKPKNTQEQKTDPKKNDASASSASDNLLECLVFLTEHFGRAKSAEALTAGLAYGSDNMGPHLFCEAAQRLGLKTKISKRPDFLSIPKSVYPIVLILKSDQACVLLSISPNRKKAKIFNPETKSACEVDIKALIEDYSDYAIYVHPRDRKSVV